MDDRTRQMICDAPALVMSRCVARFLLLGFLALAPPLSTAQEQAAHLPEVQQVLLEARSVAGSINAQDEEIKMLALVAIAAWQLAAGDASAALDTMVAKRSGNA